MKWLWRTFNELTVFELYDILALREKVFITEQDCRVHDLDYEDQQAMHLMGIQNKKLVAYLRLFLPGSRYPDSISFGRVVTDISVRKQGIATEAMKQTNLYLHEKFNHFPIIISAQLYLQKFYENFGFNVIGKPYDEGGIVHIKMRKESI